MALELTELAGRLVSEQGQLQVITLFVSVLRRIWNHISWADITPPLYLPATVITFFLLALPPLSESTLQALWHVLRSHISSWSGPLLQLEVDDLFRRYGAT